jgi:hypothetical protein
LGLIAVSIPKSIMDLSLGKSEITLGEYKVRIFDLELCIIDAFRYLSKEIAISAAKIFSNYFLQDRSEKTRC